MHKGDMISIRSGVKSKQAKFLGWTKDKKYIVVQIQNKTKGKFQAPIKTLPSLVREVLK